MSLLTRFTNEGRRVSANPSSSYAPGVFAKERAAKAAKKAFAEAIAGILIHEFGARWARVKVVKPNKFDDVRAVGVQIERFAADDESDPRRAHRGAAVLRLIGTGMVPGEPQS